MTVDLTLEDDMKELLIPVDLDFDEFIFTEPEIQSTSNLPVDEPGDIFWDTNEPFEYIGDLLEDTEEADEMDVSRLCNTFRSYRSIRRYEISLLTYMAEQDTLKCSESGLSIFFGDTEYGSFHEDDPPIELFPSCPANQRPTQLKKRAIISSASNSSRSRISWTLSSHLPLRDFPIIADSLSLEADHKTIITAADMGHLYHAGSRYAGGIAGNVALLMTMLFNSCKDFSVKLRRLLALGARAISLFSQRKSLIKEFGEPFYSSQLRNSRLDCKLLRKDLESLRTSIKNNSAFYKANAKETVELVRGLYVLDACVLKAEAYYWEHAEDEAGESYFPQLPAYRNALKFLRSHDPQSMIKEMDMEMDLVLEDLKEVEESLVTIFEAHNGN